MMRFVEPEPLKWYEPGIFNPEVEVIRNAARARSEETGILHHVDHIVPTNSPIVRGFNIPWNLQVCHGFLNSRKGNRWWPTMTASEVKEAIAFYKARGDI